MRSRGISLGEPGGDKLPRQLVGGAMSRSRGVIAAFDRRLGRPDASRVRKHASEWAPADIIGHAVWLYFRFPLGLRMVEELLAARGVIVSHETVRQWARKFGQHFANQIRRRLPRVGDKWHLDEVVLKIAGVKHWLWRAVDQAGVVLDVLVQRRRDKQAAKRLLRKLLKKQMRRPRVMITDKLATYGAAKREIMPGRASARRCFLPKNSTDLTARSIATWH
jgi:putative transposase